MQKSVLPAVLCMRGVWSVSIHEEAGTTVFRNQRLGESVWSKKEV